MEIISRRIQKYVELAVRQAKLSDPALTHAHGAVLFSHNKVLNVSHNKAGFSSFGRRFKPSALKCPSYASLHAELRAVLNVDKSSTRGSSVMVVRLNSAGKLRNSKPCAMCEQVLRFCEVKTVYYSNDNGNIEMMKL